MKGIVVILVCLLLVGGLMMPVEAKTIKFSIQLEPEEETSNITNVSVYLEGNLIGVTDNNGLIRHEFEINDTKDKMAIKQTFSLKKEGFRSVNGTLFIDDNRLFNISFGVPILTFEPTPTPTPEPTHEPMPTVPPTPEGFKSQSQQIEELQNQTADHEERIGWLETIMQKILGFLRTLGFKD